MASVVVGALVNKIVDISADLALKGVTRLLWLKEDIHGLQREMRYIQAFLHDVERKQDILDTYVPRIESHIPRFLLKIKFSKEIEKIKRRLQAIKDDKEFYEIDTSSAVDTINVDPRIRALHVDEPIVLGFDDDIRKLKVKMLSKEQQLGCVAIVGMPGIGKTTLAKKLFKGVKNKFDYFASVSVSQKPNKNDILLGLAKKLGLEKDEQEENVAANIHSFLKERRYVLLLDDIWHTDAWDWLKVSIPIDSKNGSRIIVTSRYTDVGRYIGTERSLHELQPFDFKTSWTLFSKLIIPTSESTSRGFDSVKIEEIGKRIVEKCGGVALAIVVTVGLLREREQNEFEWNMVLKSIGHDCHDKCSQILALSYNDLPASLMPCFLYMGLFPEDHVIRASDLIRMWMAEKFIQVHDGMEPEEVGEDYLRKLVARNLIQVVSIKYDGRVNRVSIHDLLHSFCVNMAKESNFFHTTVDVDFPNTSSTTRIRRLGIHYAASIGTNVTLGQKHKIRTLMYFNGGDKDVISKKHLSKRFLRVLIIEPASYYSDVQLRHLINLSYLRVRVSSLHGIAHKLKKLQTLDLRESWHGSVPIDIWEMTQLRHLLLNEGSPPAVQPSSPVKVAPNLQTLVGMWAPCLELEKLNNVKKLGLRRVNKETLKLLNESGSILEKLETLYLTKKDYLSIHHSEENETLDLNLLQYNHVKKLVINHWDCLRVNFPPNLIKLKIRDCSWDEDPMPVLKKLPSLKVLIIGDAVFGEVADLSGPDSFPQLQVLNLYSLDGKLKLGEERGMPKLREVSIKNCPGITTIPDWLRQLQKTD
ncbi:hypothetical protein BUALT_Bualt01G0219400 [Buddleja alternifolia]|uniref:AAA+ ATPase domain-containing protein n=1 Tax=Buddleja alternifolia TaxID=168488 RepID=A0AAV6YA27_9LAMI|nr:hypothetical protein BUALT_Bualt01G0219400 [Buddleja alternifolia]